jgi:hypothetical protein
MNETGDVRQVIERLEAELAEARLAHHCSEGVLSMTVDRLGGMVEGHPTQRINFLQRIDALVAMESEVERLTRELKSANQAFARLGAKRIMENGELVEKLEAAEAKLASKPAPSGWQQRIAAMAVECACGEAMEYDAHSNGRELFSCPKCRAFVILGNGQNAVDALPPAPQPTTNEVGDVVCQHGTAMDVHCCNCHSGFLFDASACVCVTDGGVHV